MAKQGVTGQKNRAAKAQEILDAGNDKYAKPASGDTVSYQIRAIQANAKPGSPNDLFRQRVEDEIENERVLNANRTARLNQPAAPRPRQLTPAEIKAKENLARAKKMRNTGNTNTAR
jgi:hypothetical protein